MLEYHLILHRASVIENETKINNYLFVNLRGL